MGDFANASKQVGSNSHATSGAYATGGTIVGSPVFNNGDNGRITTAASANSAGQAGAAGTGADFKIWALVAGVVLVLAVVFMKKKKHGGHK